MAARTGAGGTRRRVRPRQDLSGDSRTAGLRAPPVGYPVRSPVIGTGADLAGVCAGMVRAPVVGWCGGCRRPRPVLRSWRAGEALGWAGSAGKAGTCVAARQRRGELGGEGAGPPVR